MSLEDLIVTEERLGDGGFGSVFMCKLGGKAVAAKKLSQSEREFNNLVREASRLKRLRHGKHIAYTHGFTLKEEGLYMIMEYCERGDLQNYLKRNKESVTYEQKTLFCRGILLGLLYCHSMNVFHGDIKCSNVILGKNLEPKLTDFGLSMTVENIEDYCKIYEGSIHWAAPELFSMREENNFEKFKANPYPTDVYSLGATFCQVSFDGTTEFIDSDNIEMDISLGLVSPISKDAFLEKIVDECCQFERNERISLDECLTLLDTVAEDQLPIPDINDKWLGIQQDIQANSKLEPPPSFILHRTKENLVVGPSNLSLLEWLCINNCTDAVKYMIKLRKQDQNQDQDQIKWLYEISELCRSLEVAGFLQSPIQNSKPSHLVLSSLIDNHPQQFIEMLIKAGASSYSYSLLKKAIGRHHNMTVQAIIDRKNHLKKWAAYDAVKFGNAEAVKILAGAGADLQWSDKHTGYTPLKTAIDIENIEIVNILLEHGVDIDSKKNSTRTSVEAKIQYKPLHLAALKDNREIMKLLIDAGATIDIMSSEWSSLYQDLEQQGNVSMARFIGNIISKKSSPVENNSLCVAIRNKQPDLVQNLIDNGANIDEIGLNGYAPLHWAVIVGDEETVKSLIKAGADLDIKTQNLHLTSSLDYFSECTPLHIAISKKHLRIARFLIEAGADFSAKNRLKQTIMDAAKEDKKEIENIIRECAPFNAISIRRAIKSLSHESIKIVIEKQQNNAEILSECLCIAASSGKNDLVKYLLKCGVSINKEHQGKTPLWWVIFWGNIQAMEILINAGANVNMENDYWEAPLFQCVRESQLGMIKLLVDKGANVNARDKYKYAPIHYANDKDVLEILINTGADVNTKDKDGRTPLIQYVKESNAEVVQSLVEEGADVNAGDKDGNAPIHYANNKEIMKILINAGADVSAKNKHGRTPLIQSVSKSNTEMVQLLVDKGIDVNTRDEGGYISINFVDKREIAEILIAHGADINAKGKYGGPPLVKHVKKLNTEMIQFLVNKGADVNARDEDGNMPIQYTDKKDILRILINAGADVNVKDRDGETPLIRYISRSDTEMVQLLVDKGADVNARDKEGHTPIHYANDIEIMRILINAGADVNIKDQYGETLLIHYVKKSNTNMVQFLVDKGADVNARDKHGYAPIYYTDDKEIMKILINTGADISAKNKYIGAPLVQHVKESNAEVVQSLVGKGADVNARDEGGNTPIYYVNDQEIMKILINAGADISAKNKNGWTPLLHHVKESNTEIVQLLVDNGADVNARDKEIYTPIHYANKREIIETLIAAGADVSVKNKYRGTPFIESIRQSHKVMLKFLIEKGTDVNARDDYGDAPIYYANDKEVMEILINAGADVSTKSKYGVPLLIHHVKKSNTEMVQLLVNKGADINARDKHGHAPVYYSDDKEIVEILINAGADVSTKSKYGVPLLIHHVKKSNTKMVQFLLDKGADENAIGKDGNAPIHCTDDREIMEVLINAGADVNAKDGYGKTPLIKYVRESNTEMIQFLVKNGAGGNARDKDGNAPIHCTDDREVMEILIKAGAEIDAKDQYGRTCLIQFAKELNADMVRFLVEKGADINTRDAYGNAPIHYANDKEIIEILINADADINAKNQYGKTPFIESINKSSKEMIKFLIEKGADIVTTDKDGNAPVHYVRDKEIAEILFTASTDVNVKDRHGKKLFDILIEEQNRNLSNNQYERKKICELLEYLRYTNII